MNRPSFTCVRFFKRVEDSPYEEGDGCSREVIATKEEIDTKLVRGYELRHPIYVLT